MATDDNNIYKCSFTYKEKYLETYSGHTAPVYKILTNPFSEDVFISISADWTIRVWSQKENKQLLVLKSIDSNEEIVDVEWSPFCSTSFAICKKDGRFELWNLSIKTYDPVHIIQNQSANEPKRLTLKFSRKLPLILIGKSNGEIEVFLHN